MVSVNVIVSNPLDLSDASESAQPAKPQSTQVRWADVPLEAEAKLDSLTARVSFSEAVYAAIEEVAAENRLIPSCSASSADSRPTTAPGMTG